MLKSLTLTNWKSFGEERNRVELAPLTLLVGPNASGKSNALDALRFLQGAALDYPLVEAARAKLGELDHFDTLRDSKQVDHLVSTGWIERAL